MGRPPLKKSGAMTATERQMRWRARLPLRQKQQRRAAKEAELAKATIEASTVLGTKLYGVICADPPWRFEPYSRATGLDRAADNHYPTMQLDAIKTLEIPAASNCVLFLWATAPMLPQALDVMAAWGFEYRSHLIWEKDRTGTGYWVRNRHEPLLIGTRGHIPAPAPGDQSVSVIHAPVGEHSQKPEIFAQDIERLYPNVPKIELFARRHRAGWDSWGNEAARGELAVGLSGR
jgi:N6-adenosine-specific RNA methylase IME4